MHPSQVTCIFEMWRTVGHVTNKLYSTQGDNMLIGALTLFLLSPVALSGSTGGATSSASIAANEGAKLIRFQQCRPLQSEGEAQISAVELKQGLKKSTFRILISVLKPILPGAMATFILANKQIASFDICQELRRCPVPAHMLTDLMFSVPLFAQEKKLRVVFTNPNDVVLACLETVAMKRDK